MDFPCLVPMQRWTLLIGIVITRDKAPAKRDDRSSAIIAMDKDILVNSAEALGVQRAKVASRVKCAAEWVMHQTDAPVQAMERSCRERAKVESKAQVKMEKGKGQVSTLLGKLRDSLCHFLKIKHTHRQSGMHGKRNMST